MSFVAALVCAVVLVTALVSTGSASAARPKPEGVLIQALKYLSLGQYGREYDLLHPGQKKLIPRQRFVGCWMKSVPHFDLISIKKIDEYRDPIRLLGVSQRVSQAVTFRITLRSSTGTTETFNQTWNAVWVGSRWTWVLQNASVRAFVRGACPT
jgi:hypothetical protein